MYQCETVHLHVESVHNFLVARTTTSALRADSLFSGVTHTRAPRTEIRDFARVPRIWSLGVMSVGAWLTAPRLRRWHILGALHNCAAGCILGARDDCADDSNCAAGCILGARDDCADDSNCAAGCILGALDACADHGSWAFASWVFATRTQLHHTKVRWAGKPSNGSHGRRCPKLLYEPRISVCA